MKRRSRLKKSIPIIITVSIMLFSAIGIFCVLYFTPERSVNSKISSMAADYYENYLYKSPSSSAKYDKQIFNEEMQKYELYGFPGVSLRQLLLYDNKKYFDQSDFLKTYCDEEKTYVKFFPIPPYNKTDYTIEYTLVCDFD